MVLLFDVPLAPIYFGVVFPSILIWGMPLQLAGSCYLRPRFSTRKRPQYHWPRRGLHASTADAHAESLARNSQVINAMGMLNEGILLWGRRNPKP